MNGPEIHLQLIERLRHHLEAIYRDVELPLSIEQLTAELITQMRLDQEIHQPQAHVNHWDQSDALLISYGDSLLAEGEKPLVTLKRFLDERAGDLLSGVHILPFYPWSSDDGFAVLDYSSVNESLGDWGHVEDIAAHYDLMADLVINHCSGRSLWFENFIRGREPGRGYFFTASPEDDLSQVVRPRTSSLLREVETVDGVQHVWCTFSHDQVDLDFRNPEVLKQFVSIVRQYLDSGVRVFRLDAVAFLWKIPGTTCLNLEQTHEVVRLLRTLVEHARPDAMLITETNIPNRENLSYFGNANEAHCVYNFSLPPLLVNALITGDCTYLKHWMMSMPPPQNGTAYFNFIASHDGIGLRPAEGLLSQEELSTLMDTMERFGGHISYRALESGENKPYEINISLADALSGTVNGPDAFGEARLICAHAVMLGLEGIPGIYLHSLLATRNDHERVERTGHRRAINRHQWDYAALETLLDEGDNGHARVFAGLRTLLEVRRCQAAFHPNATQFTLHLGQQVFGFWRQSMDRRQSVFCINNLSDSAQEIQCSALNLIDMDEWSDLLGDTHLHAGQQILTLRPYQTLWLTNLPDHAGT